MSVCAIAWRAYRPPEVPALITATGLRYMLPEPTSQSNAFLTAPDPAGVLGSGHEHDIGGVDAVPPILDHSNVFVLAVGVERGDVRQAFEVVDGGPSCLSDPRRQRDRRTVRRPLLQASAHGEQADPGLSLLASNRSTPRPPKFNPRPTTVQNDPVGLVADRPDRTRRSRPLFLGGPPVHDDSIHLDEYDPRRGRRCIREARPPDSSPRSAPPPVGVEHVGSTSVPGLAAKPIIDIVLTVPDSSDEARRTSRRWRLPATRCGSANLPGSSTGCSKVPDTDVNVHVFSAGHAQSIERMVDFRDPYLRTDRYDRELYERTKRELAARHWKYVQHYANAKSDVVAEIMTRAEPPQERPITGPDTDVQDAV